MNLLCPLDLSEGSERVLRHAADLARRLEATVYLIHVAPPDPDFVGYEAGPDTVRKHLAERFHEEHRELQAHAESLRADKLTATALLVQGPTVDVILQEADKLEASMIVVGSHGHGAMHHLLVGSVSEGVIRRSPVPVLVVPTHGEHAA